MYLKISSVCKDTLLNLLGDVLSAKLLNLEEAEGVNKQHVSTTDQACDMTDSG